MYRKAGMCGLLVLFSAAGIRAEPTRKVVIKIGWPCSQSIPAKIGVVLNGDETHRFTATYHADVDRWIGEWQEEDKTFNAANSKASLRLGPGRTVCRRSFPVKDASIPNAYVAAFTFDCDERAAWDVSVRTEPSTMYFSYERTVMMNSGPPCEEKASFDDHPRTVSDLWFPGEDLLVGLGRDKLKLVVFWHDVTMAPLFVKNPKSGDSPVVHRLFQPFATTPGVAVSLTKQSLVTALQTQAAAAQTRTSSASPDYYEKKLADLTSVELAVVKK